MRQEIRQEPVRRASARLLPSMGAILVLAVTACTEPPPPPPEVMMEGDDPTTPFLGAWDLVDWRIVHASGEATFPYGEDARGQIVYTDDGRMSAHLMRLPDTSGATGGSGEAGFQSFHYWGDFTVDLDAETVTHHVLGSSSESWVGSDQVRGFEFLGEDRVILTAPRTLSDGSPGPPQRLTWVRVR